MKTILHFTGELIGSGILILVVIFLRYTIAKIVRRYAMANATFENRTNLVIKYIHILINLLALVALIVIWGVQRKDILLVLSSITTVVGVAMFAQWSILSNITSGIILFFFFPFKIGDMIKIHDKDFPIQGEIIDINAFHVDIKTVEGENVTYPNNLLLQKGISIIRHYDDKHQEFMD